MKEAVSTYMDVSSSYFSKNSYLQMIFCLFGNAKYLLISVEILIIAAVQSNALLFAFSWKIKLKKNQLIR